MKIRKVFAVSMLCLVTTTAVAQSSSYTFKDLGSLTGRASHALGLNDVGQVVGSSEVTGTIGSKTKPAEPFTSHAFFFNEENMIGPAEMPAMDDLGVFDDPSCDQFTFGCQSEATDINNDGLISGSSVGARRIPVVWSRGPVLPQGIYQLPDPDELDRSARPFSINMAGDVVGFISMEGIPLAIRWLRRGNDDSWLPQLLGTLNPGNAGSSVAGDINDSGHIVGQASLGSGVAAFLYLPEPEFGLPAGMQQILPSSGDASRATAINNHAEVVGWTVVEGVFMPWMWSPETGVVDLDRPIQGVPGATGVRPSDINDQGHIVGSAVGSETEFSAHDVILINNRWMALESLIQDNPNNWRLISTGLGPKLNEFGQISGTAFTTELLDINQLPQIHAFRLDPVVGISN